MENRVEFIHLSLILSGIVTLFPMSIITQLTVKKNRRLNDKVKMAKLYRWPEIFFLCQFPKVPIFYFLQCIFEEKKVKNFFIFLCSVRKIDTFSKDHYSTLTFKTQRYNHSSFSLFATNPQHLHFTIKCFISTVILNTFQNEPRKYQ